ncbi:hypothetical protein CDD81_5105 [Ophiocordyceps australis]|uniref:Molybdopterin synthase catalytic subunit n=1 Tax=Ophiocordyceps australis TaxID=1399860 RepID=A0A2C5Y982_9HYPO|nr:hypothetical protein CDD81_5105 [Ophiocordyceps australis]
MDPSQTEQEVAWHLDQESCYVGLTYDSLDAKYMMDKVRRPDAGAIVLFAGTTRNNFAGRSVKQLAYSAYRPLALRTMLSVAQDLRARHSSLRAIALVHRLGHVPVGEESILIAVSAPHRHEAWRAAEEALDECKERVEVWKREEFDDGEGVWRANQHHHHGQRIS